MARIILSSLIVIVLLGVDCSISSPAGSPGVAFAPHTALATQDATSAWNSVCASWGFPQAPVASNRSTFEEVWVQQGPITLEAACAGVTAQVNSILGSITPPITGDDSLNFTIQNWG